MLKKILIMTGMIGAALTLQTPANASYVTGKLAEPIAKSQTVGKYEKRAIKNVHHKHYRLTNQELRYKLRRKGLRHINIHSRGHGVAVLTAHNVRGYIGRYKVSTKTGAILHGKVIRYYGHKRPHVVHKPHRKFHHGHVRRHHHGFYKPRFVVKKSFRFH